ncbi:MAG: acyltransferase [Actinobacteria bacterium]|nr:acyltransferase [Actinomycetota bacterium]
MLNPTVPWPGTAALWPALATVAVIVAGFGAGPAGPVRLLGRAPLVWVGGLSYSLYLWHWPLLQMVQWRLGPVSPAQGLAVAVLSVGPAWLAHRWVERPMRHPTTWHASPRLTLSIGVNLSLIPVLAGLVLWSGAAAPFHATALADPATHERWCGRASRQRTVRCSTCSPPHPGRAGHRRHLRPGVRTSSPGAH